MPQVPEVLLDELSVDESRLLASLVNDRVASRLFRADSTLWGASAEPEASIRLGWIDAHTRAGSLIDEIATLRKTLLAQGVNRIVLCGMGGSSLAPEVIARRDGVSLTILDSTHPDAVRRVLGVDPTHTAVVVSSKSGSTIETRTQHAAFVERFTNAGINPADRIVVVTDPGSPLEQDSRAAGSRVFLADPHVGGRYSALTAFGLVPAGLAGANVQQLVQEAAAAHSVLQTDSEENPALRLAAALASGVPERYACYLVENRGVLGLGDWIEQLVAESTGKSETGVLPVVLSEHSPEVTQVTPYNGRLVLLDAAETIADVPATPAAATTMPGGSPAPLRVSASLGAQMLLWETATAVLCRLLGVNPFDQPDVESAKTAARDALAKDAGDVTPLVVYEGATEVHVLESPAEVAEDLTVAIDSLARALPTDGYLAIHAYLDPSRHDDSFTALRDAFSEAWKIPVTLGWGPRFLHSTGQFHKGGPKTGGYLQVIDVGGDHTGVDAGTESGAHSEDDRRSEDAILSGDGVNFADLIVSQARGDRDVLTASGRPVLAVRVDDALVFAQMLETMLRQK